ncbi:hypothetical protein [Sulfobacillus harzensis]|uniref:WD40 repeat domain-containing protein n=1 Tax=Sulfobacillus harzensis TaxID=2729629 RepID=A0A7Y0L5V6_9FIRM|nr:hypothetical protein [Sulfobacillus harzensis]NMP23847.1 hypothetical protein [Sulfobacillus harzensis]
MKRPVSLLLLFVFAAIQIYFARVPLSHQVQGSSWIEVSRQAGGLVERQGRYYLVTPTDAFHLSANQAHITATKDRLSWVDVPEPSGAGVWKLAVGPSSLPLVGVGAPVYPAPDGQSVLWIDGSTRIGYLSMNGEDGMRPISSKMGSIQSAVWAPDSQALGVAGQGPQGFGAYIWDRDGNLTPMALPSPGIGIAALGFSQDDRLLVGLKNGKVLYQGRGVVSLPPLSPLALAKNHADILGETANNVIFWQNGTASRYPRPDLKWVGRVAFSADGHTAATLSQSVSGGWHLLIYGSKQHLEISLPFAKDAEYHLVGFLGSHWILVTVPSGPHHGTYAWWVQG